ncbi:TetR/AcrR family transcriptional regulator [Niveispirillum irakense]|uniref:TetR/AcrR family transcriptional regulator n=1 Tax=Niveispirillum irakense TaxID=34011 RepID=UPI000424CB66|nr:TetR/AcrR family transcriptional regulator [Niveispirillum irakense]
MRVSKEKSAEHRAAIVEAAGRLFREKGVDGVGVAEITRAAGLTHGGFYGHFASKDALAAEACADSFQTKIQALDAASDLAAFIDQYLSETHVKRRDIGCPMPAWAGEVARQDTGMALSFAVGLADYTSQLAGKVPEGAGPRDERALALLSMLVGAVTLARAVAESNPDLANRILAAARGQAKALAGLD